MPLGSLKSKRMPPGATQKCDACLEQAILEFFRPDSSRRSKSRHSSVFFKSAFDNSSGNMAVACTIRRNKRSFYRRVHVDKLATPHSLDLISRLYGDTMPLSLIRLNYNIIYSLLCNLFCKSHVNCDDITLCFAERRLAPLMLASP